MGAIPWATGRRTQRPRSQERGRLEADVGWAQDAEVRKAVQIGMDVVVPTGPRRPRFVVALVAVRLAIVRELNRQMRPAPWAASVPDAAGSFFLLCLGLTASYTQSAPRSAHRPH